MCYIFRISQHFSKKVRSKANCKSEIYSKSLKNICQFPWQFLNCCFLNFKEVKRSRHHSKMDFEMKKCLKHYLKENGLFPKIDQTNSRDLDKIIHHEITIDTFHILEYERKHNWQFFNVFSPQKYLVLYRTFQPIYAILSSKMANSEIGSSSKYLKTNFARNMIIQPWG